MGQQCCGPNNHGEPKYVTLLTMAYREAVTDLDEPVVDYLNRKGYIRTLCDHLSSHVQNINPSLVFCKNKMLSVRNKNTIGELRYCIVTTEVCEKIVKLGDEIAQKKGQMQTNKSIRAKDSFPSRLQKKNTSTKYGQSRSKSKKKKSEEVIPWQLIEQYKSNIYEITEEIMRQNKSLVNLFSDSTHSEYDSVMQSEIKILKTLNKVTSKSTKSVKTSFNVTLNLLNQLIDVLMACDKGLGDGLLANESDQYHDEQSGNQRNFNKQVGRRTSVISTTTPSASKRPSKIQSIPQPYNSTLVELVLVNYRNLLQNQVSTLSNTNESGNRSIVKQHLSKLLSFWANDIDGRQKQSQKTFQNKSSSSLSCSSEWQLSNQQGQKNAVQTHIQQIIYEYFNNYFAFTESEQIYRQLIIIFDRLNFNRDQIQPIEILFFKALSKFELRENFIYKWFDYMLDYLAMIGTSQKNTDAKNTNNNATYLEQISENYNFHYIKPQYANILKEENIVGCLQTIHRWIASKKLQLDDLLKYKGNKMFVAVLVNLSRGSVKIREEVIKFMQNLIYQNVGSYVNLIESTCLIIDSLKVDPYFYLKKMVEVQENYQRSLALTPEEIQKQKSNKQKEKAYAKKYSSKSFTVNKASSFQRLQSKNSLKQTYRSFRDSIIPVDEFMQELMLVAEYGYFYDYQGFLDYRLRMLKFYKKSKRIGHNGSSNGSNYGDERQDSEIMDSNVSRNGSLAPQLPPESAPFFYFTFNQSYKIFQTLFKKNKLLESKTSLQYIEQQQINTSNISYIILASRVLKNSGFVSPNTCLGSNMQELNEVISRISKFCSFYLHELIINVEEKTQQKKSNYISKITRSISRQLDLDDYNNVNANGGDLPGEQKKTGNQGTKRIVKLAFSNTMYRQLYPSLIQILSSNVGDLKTNETMGTNTIKSKQPNQYYDSTLLCIQISMKLHLKYLLKQVLIPPVDPFVEMELLEFVNCCCRSNLNSADRDSTASIESNNQQLTSSKLKSKNYKARMNSQQLQLLKTLSKIHDEKYEELYHPHTEVVSLGNDNKSAKKEKKKKNKKKENGNSTSDSEEDDELMSLIKVRKNRDIIINVCDRALGANSKASVKLIYNSIYGEPEGETGESFGQKIRNFFKSSDKKSKQATVDNTLVDERCDPLKQYKTVNKSNQQSAIPYIVFKHQQYYQEYLAPKKASKEINQSYVEDVGEFEVKESIVSSHYKTDSLGDSVFLENYQQFKRDMN